MFPGLDKDIVTAVTYSVTSGFIIPKQIRELPRPMLEHAFMVKLVELHELKKAQRERSTVPSGD